MVQRRRPVRCRGQGADWSSGRTAELFGLYFEAVGGGAGSGTAGCGGDEEAEAKGVVGGFGLLCWVSGSADVLSFDCAELSV